MKKYLVLLLSLCFITACGKKYDTIDTQEEADRINKQTEVKNETVIVPDKVYFAFDSSTLNAESRKSLDTVAEWLNSKTEVNIILEGHCDERGTREYNLALGQRRAEAAKNYLVSKKVSPKRIKVISYGKERPEFVGKGEAIWAKNRRAVVVEVK